ncbi:c-type cytochrome [Massilia sp. CF038]|uniref:c-type cytochrome n=1 Tax=Massilia sp. CF038 TaxID=1881045 RepID=UPI0009137B35|nr:c-type cytochrome [Massilia sp. CF038]SHG64996.1 Cytochrome c, mono-and diheme variants [Massilia sp. CF038]
MKRILTALMACALAVLGAVYLFQRMHDAGSALPAVAVADRAAQITRGAYLAKAGNCMGCHTANGGQPYAGGRALETPFGVMYAPNLTADAATGIGSWSADDFWRALHNGKSKDGRFLYPAFPYPNYTKVTRADADAMFAWFGTVPAVRQPNRAHALRFPYNQRALLAFWRALYFTPGEFVPEPGQSVLWNRGAYLVQGLGHCSACHAPRNALGASVGELRLGGGTLGEPEWHAPALGGVGDTMELAELLQTGVSGQRALSGPMAQVAGASLQHLKPDDVSAMASYLVTLPAAVPQPARALPEGSATVLRHGARLYEQHCASCHGEQGEGEARVYPRLAGRGAHANGLPGNAIRMVLDGGYGPSTQDNPRPFGMPPFSATLSDADVAAVLSHVRTSWGNQGSVVLPQEVGRLRATPGR